MWNLQYHQIQLAPSTWSTTTNRVSTIQNMGGSENLWKSREHLWSLPFPGIIYVTEHGENNYYQKGFGAENPRMKHNPNKFTMLLKKAYKILNSRPLSPVLRDFSTISVDQRDD